MTDASNDACSSGAVRSTASVSRLGLFQGVPEEADKAGCKVELAQNYQRSRPYHKDKLSGLRLGFVFFWARLAGLADDFFPRVLWADHRDLCSIKNKAVWPKPGRFPLPNPSDEAAKATAATTSFWDLFFRCRLLPLFVNQPPHSTVCAHYKFSNIARNSGHVCAGTERPAGSTKLMVHDLFASQGGERVWFAG
ncbi:hypothetical protein PoMZ_00209 [Pyricularia oryzae]|uniref:Uncharacterized protein n=1 Tax=Pyricularia oryzae TaxID=318829 RepID=A0A4P7MZI4_PYROR|nr:hypothetical protein PoMZ_00209 [Pyricularia oryzae]